MKYCSRCKTTKNKLEFGKHKTTKDRLQWICKICSARVKREWYTKNKELQNQRVRRNQDRAVKENRKIVWEYLKVHPCTDCGIKNIAVLEFDHLRDKRANISVMMARGYGNKTLLDEIAKCEVVCRNCHIIRTSLRGRHWRTILSGV